MADSDSDREQSRRWRKFIASSAAFGLILYALFVIASRYASVYLASPPALASAVIGFLVVALLISRVWERSFKWPYVEWLESHPESRERRRSRAHQLRVFQLAFYFLLGLGAFGLALAVLVLDWESTAILSLMLVVFYLTAPFFRNRRQILLQSLPEG